MQSLKLVSLDFRGKHFHQEIQANGEDSLEECTVKHKQKHRGDGQDARKALPQQLRASSDSFGCRAEARRDTQTSEQLPLGEQDLANAPHQ